MTHIRHQGNFVASYTDEEAEQAKVARSALEGLAGELACGRLDDDTRARLVALIDRMHDAAVERNLTEFRELDFTFHRTVIEASGNAYLPRMWDIIEPSLRSMHVLGDPKFAGDWHQVADWHRSLLNDADVREAFRSAAAVVVPVEDVPQPSGQSVTLQASACARPVVLTRTRGLWDPDGLRDGENVLLVPPADPVALAAAVGRVLSDRDLGEALGAAARQSVTAAASVERYAERLLAICGEALARP